MEDGAFNSLCSLAGDGRTKPKTGRFRGLRAHFTPIAISPSLWGWSMGVTANPHWPGHFKQINSICTFDLRIISSSTKGPFRFRIRAVHLGFRFRIRVTLQSRWGYIRVRVRIKKGVGLGFRFRVKV